MTSIQLAVGSELPPLRVEPISRKTLALFAGASGDHQPSHIDIDAARAKGRDDVIAHGMLTMAYMSRLLTDHFRQADVISYSARFLSFTPVHGQPICTARVVSAEGGEMELALAATLPNGTIVATGQARVRVPES